MNIPQLTALCLRYQESCWMPAEAAHENAQRHRQLSCHGMATHKHPNGT